VIEQIEKDQEDLAMLGSSLNQGEDNEEDEKYNQEMFLKRKAEMEGGTLINGNRIKQLLVTRKPSGGDSSDEEEAEIEDMGLFGGKLAQFRKL
jgi:hypothetical protein